MCAGAWFVRQAIAALRSEDCAVDFEKQLYATREKGLILHFAEGIGLPIALVAEIMSMNDALPESGRVSGMLDFLPRLELAA